MDNGIPKAGWADTIDSAATGIVSYLHHCDESLFHCRHLALRLIASLAMHDTLV